jgi:hypothetical protein
MIFLVFSRTPGIKGDQIGNCIDKEFRVCCPGFKGRKLKMLTQLSSIVALGRIGRTERKCQKRY